MLERKRLAFNSETPFRVFLHEGSQLDLLRPLKPLKNTRTIEDVQVIAIDWEFAFVTIKDILIVYFK